MKTKMAPTLNFIQGLPLPSPATHVPRNGLCSRPHMTAAAASHTLNGKSISGPIQPAGHNILVKVAEAAETTSGGLILSGAAKETPTYGEAIEIGPGKYYGNGIQIPMHVGKGDVVLYGKYGGTDVDYDGEKHTLVTQDDILCKLNNGEFSATAVEPIFDRVLVKVDEAAESTSSGIILSKTAKEKSTQGKIVSMGPGRFMENGEMEPAAFAVGDTVLYGKYAGTPVDFTGDEYMLIRVADIFAKY